METFKYLINKINNKKIVACFKIFRCYENIVVGEGFILERLTLLGDRVVVVAVCKSLKVAGDSIHSSSFTNARINFKTIRTCFLNYSFS